MNEHRHDSANCLTIAGHSGCWLQLLDHRVIRKGTNDPAYAPRLRKQIEKQRTFPQRVQLADVSVPEILNEVENGSGGFYADMEYCAASDFVQYFLASGRTEIDAVIFRILRLIEAMEANCTVEAIPRDILQKKFWEVMSGLWRRVRSGRAELLIPPPSRPGAEHWTLDAGFLAHCESWFARNVPAVLDVPVGECHGDLTFSNILINAHRRRLVLLDFLDCFIESPIQDMVKLRQDTLYQWSFDLYRDSFDRTRLAIVMEYIDRHLTDAFRQRPYYNECYDIFQFMNFLRILPYAKDEGILARAVGVLDDLMRPWPRAPSRVLRMVGNQQFQIGSVV